MPASVISLPPKAKLPWRCRAIGPCAFSSLAATRDWLKTDMAKSFTRAYRKARAWLIATPAAEVAKAEASYFKDIDLDVNVHVRKLRKTSHSGS